VIVDWLFAHCAKLGQMRLSCALVVIGLVAANTAMAQEGATLSGRWSAGVLRSVWTLTDWGDTCGPSPVGNSEAGGVVTVTQQGQDIRISGLGRPFSSNSCWDQQPGVSPVSHAGQLGRWTTTCKSAASDPRRVTIVTTLVASGSTIDMAETGQFGVAIAGRNCSATVKRSRHFALIEREDSVPEPTPSARSEKPVSTCSQPGPAARLEASPSYKLLKPGDKFGFRAKVFDERGCPITQKVAWQLVKSSPRAELDQNGSLTLKEDAPEGELPIKASVGDQSVQITVYVVSAERYQELLSSPTFNASGESDAKVIQSLAPSVVGARSALIDTTARRRRTLFIWAVATLAGLLGIGAYLAARVRRDRVPIQSPIQPEAEISTYSVSEVQSPATTAYICPVCGMQYGQDSQFCGKDGASLVPIN